MNEKDTGYYVKILVIFVMLFVIDMLVVDPIPFVDEIALAVGIFRNIEKALGASSSAVRVKQGRIKATSSSMPKVSDGSDTKGCPSELKELDKF
ncbi:MAG: hypothetical protein NC393_10265 [Clostridium sp.]|nr:hypothetical protein [Clostridium sp.]MCM1207486.1 hypothetical protein [Ruminococcus sp.]